VLPYELDAGLGVRSVTDEVAQLPEFVKPSALLGIPDDAFQGLEVAMDVGEYYRAQVFLCI
jgi:hypothetical protein